MRQFVWRILFLFLAFISPVVHAGSEPVWGVNALTLKPACAGVPSVDELLADGSNTVSLNQFYHAGGENVPVMPTECRVAYNRDTLFVVFRCKENDLSFPATNHNANWFGQLAAPSDQDASFPDKVEILVLPDWTKPTCYQFAATLDGLKFGCQRQLRSTVEDEESTDASRWPGKITRTDAFEATVLRRDKVWVVFFGIPWKTVGGMPHDYFGLLPVRTRWRDAEVSSLVAIDFRERLPFDLFIETHFAEAAPVSSPESSLCQLPSGAWRWQRPARLRYPDAETVRQIWDMEQSLDQPTDKDNLSSRLSLTQSWMNLLELEGFNFATERGSIVPENLMPFVIRRQMNNTLRTNNLPAACQMLDGYLHKLDKVSRRWFADGSPGDILTAEWKPVSELNQVEAKNKVLWMQGLAGGREVDLHLSLPKSGGVRIYGEHEGHFRPDALLDLNLGQSSNACTVGTADGKIIIIQKPFTITLLDAVGKAVTQIGPGDISFRFDPDGKIMAVDFKSRLRADEVIHGFGERYDHFNENGHVFTLWGMDDWSGNTIGLRNQTYKPIPVFQSSRGGMVFDNSTYRLRADVGETRPDQMRLTQQGPIFDYYFWSCPPEQALESYTDLTGKPVLPPKWAFEPWMGRTGRGWNAGPLHNMVAEEESVVNRFETLDIPHSAIYAEGSGNADSPALNQFMSHRGIRVLSWFYPVISETRQAELMPELKPAELPCLHATDEKAARQLGYVDFTNPNALELFRRWWQHRLDVGVAGSMVDFGDRVPEDAVFYDGRKGDEMHNFYAYDYHRTCAEVFREKRGDDFILFGRAAAPGTQKWVAQFGGDHRANFVGLQAVLTGVLNLSTCGFSTWGSDLGGFLGWPEPQVYMRWTQFGCFSPLMRCHGRTPREPWNYGDAAVANYKYFTWVRENLLNYIYNSAIHAHETGIPMVRSMAVAYPDDISLAAVADQYMFGSDLLVAPVITENNSRIIRFPAGQWTSLWDGETVSGPTNVNVSVPLNKTPVYLKPGALMPIQLDSALELGASMTPGRVNVLLVTPPTETETVSLPNIRGRSASVSLSPSQGGFSATLKNLPETDCVLVYGSAVTAVKINGENLPNLPGAKFDSMPRGWCADPAMNRVVIRLPKDQNEPRGSAVEIQITIQKKNTNK